MTDYVLKTLAGECNAKIDHIRTLSASIQEHEEDLEAMRHRREVLIAEADALVEAIIELGGQPAEQAKEQVG